MERQTGKVPVNDPELLLCTMGVRSILRFPQMDEEVILKLEPLSSVSLGYLCVLNGYVKSVLHDVSH